MNEQKKPNLMESFERFQEATVYGALGAMPLMRRKLGLRIAKSFHLGVAAALPLALGIVTHSTPLMAYAAIVFLIGQWQGFHRWQEFKHGEGIHTYTHGVSPFYSVRLTKRVRTSPLFTRFPFLNRIRVPRQLMEENRVHRYLDPLLAFACGLVAFCFNHPLGEYLMFSGICLRIFEEYSYGKQIEALLDPFDAGENADALGKLLASLRKPRPASATDSAAATAEPDEDDEPIWVGEAGDDIREQIAQRLAEQEARAEARRNGFTEAADTIREAAEAGAEAAGAVKDAAEAVSALWEAVALARETIIIATERMTREVVIVKPQYTTERMVMVGPIPDGMTAQEWLLTYSVYPDRLALTPEQQAAILKAHDERKLTGDTTPIMVQPPATPDEDEAQPKAA